MGAGPVMCGTALAVCGSEWAVVGALVSPVRMDGACAACCTAVWAKDVHVPSTPKATTAAAPITAVASFVAV
jgi:hypothetical protein